MDPDVDLDSGLDAGAAIGSDLDTGVGSDLNAVQLSAPALYQNSLLVDAQTGARTHPLKLFLVLEFILRIIFILRTSSSL